MNSGQTLLAKRTQKSRVNRKLEVVESSEPSWDLRKATETLKVRNISSIEITFLVRKAYNAMLQIAQSEIQATGNREQITFECSLKKFEELVGHSTSNSRDHLKQVLRQVQSYQVEFDYQGQYNGKKREHAWSVASMVSEVTIFEESAIVQFSFPPKLKEQMLSPQMYNSWDMRMQNKFTCHSALALFEIVSRYFTAPSLATFKDHWTNWSMLLSGSSQPHASFRDFNKMLKRATDQVNDHVPEYSIKPHVTKSDRKYDMLWFIIEPKKQAVLDLETTSEMVSKDVQDVLNEFGLQGSEIAEIIIKFDEEYILAQADFVRRRQAKKGADPITSPKAYFRKALDANYAEAPRISSVRVLNQKKKEKAILAPPPAESPKKTKMETLKGAWKAAKINEIKKEFTALPEDEQVIKLKEIEAFIAGSIIWNQYKKKGMSSSSVASSVFEKMFELKHKEPSAEEILAFAVEHSSL